MHYPSYVFLFLSNLILFFSVVRFLHSYVFVSSRFIYFLSLVGRWALKNTIFHVLRRQCETFLYKNCRSLLMRSILLLVFYTKLPNLQMQLETLLFRILIKILLLFV